MGVLDKIKPGVVYGKELHFLYEICKKEGFAIPSINCIGTNSINAVLEAAKEINSPIMIQFSNSGSIISLHMFAIWLLKRALEIVLKILIAMFQ